MLVTIRKEFQTFKIRLVNLRLLILLLREWWTTKTINGTQYGVNMLNRWRVLSSKLVLIEISKVLEKLWNKSKLLKPKHKRCKVKLLQLKSYRHQQSMMMSSSIWNKEFKQKWANTKFCWMINQLSSKKCTPMLSWWSTEINKSSKTKKKLSNWNMKLTSTFLRLSRKQPLLPSCNRNFKKESWSTKLLKKTLRN